METPKIPFHTVNPEEPYDGDLVWTADGRAWAFYAAKHGWNRAPERDRKPTPEPDDEKIERMARAMCEELGGEGTVSSWYVAEEKSKNLYRTYAKAALAALETPATPKLPEGVMRTYDSSEALGLAGVISCSGRLYNTDASGMLANGYIVDEQYILDCIERDMK